MTTERPYWQERLTSAWRKAPIVWLSGVRRVGKTTLARSLEGALYLNCDLPTTAERLADPERFYRSVSQPIVVLDEVHQLPDPSRLLKIAADEYPGLKVLATGSSTLAATEKFRDSLTGRKRHVHLLPVLLAELPAFGIRSLELRLLRGGLPAALLAEEHDPERYAEWLDSFFARDVQELFRIEKRTGFLKLVETLLRQSGGLVEVTSLAVASGLSRPTVGSYLDALEVTQAVSVIRPFHGGGSQELVKQPKIYGFDTGFVAWSRGWDTLRAEDCGALWEHLVLETLLAHRERPDVHYWRDKQRREVDFVLPRGRKEVDAIECKWTAKGFDARGLRAFREVHPHGRNFLVTPSRGDAVLRDVGGVAVTRVDLGELTALLA